MSPKEFVFQITEAMGCGGAGPLYSIEWTEKGLELKYNPEDLPISIFEIIQPSPEAWKKFEFDVSQLDLKPRDIDSLDGVFVNCHIKFKKTLIKFNLLNPEFEGYDEFYKLLNNLSICREFPNGLLSEDSAWE